MIRSKKELKEYIDADNHWFHTENVKGKVVEVYASYPTRYLKKFLYYLRMQEYYINTANGSKIKGLMGLFYERKKNRLGVKLGIEIGPNCFGKGLSIYHIGSIIVNPAVRAGENCKLHGNNCIGNNGKTQEVPILGNNVDIGYGAVLIGNIKIGNDITIGSNAVVNRSFIEKSSVIVGVPARRVK